MRGRVDVVVTDVRFGVGEMNGLEFLRAVRASGNELPIVLYSAWDWTPEERAECLRAGATDVIHKPLDGFELLVARVEKLDPALRRTSGVHRTSGAFTIGRLRIDATGAVIADGRELPLTPNSRTLLAVLAAVFPKYATHADLLRAMGYESAGSRHTLSQAVAQLRKQLEGAAEIEALAGLGYRLVELPEQRATSRRSS